MIKWLEEVGNKDISLVGGKAASLGEMLRNMSKLKIKVPDGFVVTTLSFKEFIKYNDIDNKINEIINTLDFRDHLNVKRSGLKIRTLIQNGNFSESEETKIIEHYLQLSGNYLDSDGKPQTETDVAVRSSSTAEDLPDASFAGQQETFLNIRGKNQLIEYIKRCFASLFTNRAISYRNQINYEKDISIAVCIQKMVRSDLGSAGVAFSIDPNTCFKNAILINGSWGLGEMVVGGNVTPDEFILYKQNLKKGIDPIIDKKLGDKHSKLVYNSNSGNSTKIIKVEKEQKNMFCLTEEQMIELGNWVLILEKHYSEFYKKYVPVDVEWAVDGISNYLYIVQARPETVQSNTNTSVYKKYSIFTNKIPILEGVAVGEKVTTGKVRIIYSLDNRDGSNGEEEFQEGDILVTDITTPDWEGIMEKAGGIITNKGGRVCHAAIIAREFGIPTIVGTKNCTDVLKNDQIVSISCCQGEIGYIYEGNVDYNYKKYNLSDLRKTETKLMLNIANPGNAFKYSLLPHEGVGLLRLEFIINNFVKVHPNALIHYDKFKRTIIKDDMLWDKVEDLIKSYETGKEYYISKLKQGIARISSAFYPKPVIVRFSDFKSNEYKSLLGGKYFEPDEENPMIGWRGCSRYYSTDFKEAFGFECKSIKYIREEMDLRNTVVMLPFCRTIEEVIKVQKVMLENGLTRGVNNLEVYLMCEVPSNVILGEEFSKYVDGFSIGSNDLTQLTLGLDRDSELVSHIFNENNQAVKEMIKRIIYICKKNNKKIGICGQAPSDYPDFAKFLVREGINSISLIPDSFIKTKIDITELEKNL